MNANEIFEKFVNELNSISSMEEKEYAMVAVYDELSEAGYSEAEKMAIWKQMLMIA